MILLIIVILIMIMITIIIIVVIIIRAIVQYYREFTKGVLVKGGLAIRQVFNLHI